MNLLMLISITQSVNALEPY